MLEIMFQVEFQDNFDEAFKAVERAKKKALLAMGQVILDKAREYVPKDTRALMKSGRVELDPRGDHVKIIFGNEKVQYAVAVHEGQVKVQTGRKTFLRDAAMDSKPILNAIAKAYRKEFES